MCSRILLILALGLAFSATSLAQSINGVWKVGYYAHVEKIESLEIDENMNIINEGSYEIDTLYDVFNGVIEINGTELIFHFF